jgi:hypothetical protein
VERVQGEATGGRIEKHHLNTSEGYFFQSYGALRIGKLGVEKVELKTKYGLKQALIILIVFTSILSCNESIIN